jgi:hypothetical protein
MCEEFSLFSQNYLLAVNFINHAVASFVRKTHTNLTYLSITICTLEWINFHIMFMGMSECVCVCGMWWSKQKKYDNNNNKKVGGGGENDNKMPTTTWNWYFRSLPQHKLKYVFSSILLADVNPWGRWRVCVCVCFVGNRIGLGKICYIK